MANHYWIETQKYEWPAALARLMLLVAAAFLIVLIAGCHSAPSIGPDVHVTIEQSTTTVPDCGQILPASPKEPDAAAPALTPTGELSEPIAITPPVPLNWNLDQPPPAESVPIANEPAAVTPASPEPGEIATDAKPAPARKS